MRSNRQPIGPSAHAQVSGKTALLIGAGTLLAIAVLSPVYRLQDLGWLTAVTAATFFVVPCVALGWAVWRLLVRHGGRRSIMRAFVLHALAAIGFSLTWTVAFAALAYLVRQEITLSFLRQGAVWQFVWGLAIYAVLAQAVRARERLRERELAAAAAELQALRAQLDPHFLFNTLHSLTQLAREDPIATQDALERFGELMRYVLNAGRASMMDVVLEDEVAFVRNYLALERLRLGERLRLIEDIDSDALELAVPPLLLQPLVENAVRHGLAPRRAGGTIRLTIRADDSALAIEVSDDGAGAEPELWRQASGLGLKAVQRQLHAHFADAARLEIATRPNAGFTAQLRLPPAVARRGHG
jgi:signal transduction histidine kinase